MTASNQTNTASPYFASRGLAENTVPEALNDALRLVLESMPTVLYGDATDEFSAQEQAVLAAGGIDLNRRPARDPIAETTVQFAALIESSLSTREVAERLGVPENQVRQMITRRTLYSILLNNRRYIPCFQFENDNGTMVNNITRVNAVLPDDLHPVEVFDWYTKPDLDLFLGDNSDLPISPLAWLRAGGDYRRLISLVTTI